MPHRQVDNASPPIPMDRTVTPDRADRDLTVVERVKQLGHGSGVYEVRWRDGRRRRNILLAIESHATAERTIAHAVANQYPPDQRPYVLIPTRAWR